MISNTAQSHEKKKKQVNRGGEVTNDERERNCCFMRLVLML